MSKHSPGPWKVIPGSGVIWSEDGTNIAEVNPLDHLEGQGFANARLIADAPAMLEALGDALSSLCVCDAKDWATVEEQNEHCECRDPFGLTKKIRSILARHG